MLRVSILLLWCVTGPQGADATQVRELIERLKSERAEDREAATRKLRSLGAEAAPELKKAAESGDAELASRAKYLLKVIRVSSELTPLFNHLVPDAADRVAGGDEHTWTEILLGLSVPTDEGKVPYERLGETDLRGPLEQAFRGARTVPERSRLCRIVADRRVLPLTGAIVALLGDPSLREEALETLARVAPDADERTPDLDEPREFRIAVNAVARMQAADALASLPDLLKARDELIREIAVAGHGELRVKEAVLPLTPLLADPSSKVRVRTVLALVKLKASETAVRIVPLLRDKEPAVRIAALEAVVAFRAREGAPIVRELLSDPTAAVRLKSLAALVALDARETGPAVIPLLKDADPAVGARAVEVLVGWEADAAAADIALLLKNNNPSARSRAAQVLGGLAAKSYSVDVLALLKDEHESPRASGALALGAFQEKSSAPAIERLLADPSPVVRGTAAKALAELGASDAAPRIAALLKEREWYVRLRAIRALELLEARQFLPQVCDLMRDEESSVAGAAITCLGKIGSTKDIEKVRPLLSAEDPYVARIASEALVRLGSRDGIPRLLAQPVELSSLNALRSGDSWKRLASTRLSDEVSGAPKSILTRWCSLAGMKLDWPENADLAAWSVRNYRIHTRCGTRTLLEALEELTNGHCGFVLEKDKLTIVPARQAEEFWRGWSQSLPSKRE
jgi:HEAT repeat protein